MARNSPKNLLFVLDHVGYFRHVGELFRLLAVKGNQLHIAIDRLETENLDSIDRNNLLELQELVRKFPAQVTTGPSVHRHRTNRWYHWAKLVRSTQDYLRYFDPIYPHGSKLVKRSREWVPAWVVAVSAFLPLGNARFRRAASRFLDWLESGISTAPEIDQFLKNGRYDAVWITPLVTPAGSFQTDYIKSARAAGIPAGVLVASWDNLTNKGLLRMRPDYVTVWNAAQKQEAVQLHEIAPDNVAVTGAQTWDGWFDRTVSRSRDAFFAENGLNPALRTVLYCCSSKFIAPNETEFVERWLAALNAKEPFPFNVLVRPHPQALQKWRLHGRLAFAPTSVWPMSDSGTTDEQGRADFYDSVFYCDAVVGLNTSTLVEAAILDKPILTVVDKKHAGTQEGTLHFHLLTRDSSGAEGLLQVAHGFEEHRRQLVAAMEDPSTARSRCRTFVQSFVRPHGRDIPAVSFLEQAIESSITGPRTEPVAPSTVAGWLTAPLAFAYTLTVQPPNWRLRPNYGRTVG